MEVNPKLIEAIKQARILWHQNPDSLDAVTLVAEEITRKFPELALHQGFSNYATFSVYMFIYNDKFRSDGWRQSLRETRKAATWDERVENGTWTYDQAVRFSFEDELKSILGNHLEYMSEIAGELVPAMAEAGFAMVNWQELADYFIRIWSE